MLSAQNLHKSYGTLEIIKGVDLQISKAEIVSIVGASGAGKSTLLHLLGTLDKADQGKISFDGTELQTMKDVQLSAFRNKNIGFIFQFHHLLPEFTALENICIPAFIGNVSKSVAEKRAMDLLRRMNLSDRADHKPSELSGGEQQRVAIARALINQPKIVFADEPTGNLDSNNAKEINELFLSIRKEFDVAIVIVTHNLELAAIADRKLTMKDGKLIV